MSTTCKSLTGLCLVAGLLTGLMQTGCSRSGVPQPRVVKYDYDPLQVVRRYLEGYIDGVPVGSERELFPKLVDEIRNIAADKAAAVESGLAEIVKSPATARARAKKLLDEL
jgi:hypothetical protein